MIHDLIQTEFSCTYLFIRVVAGIIIFPYGMQKIFGWYGGAGISKTIEQLRARRIPMSIAWLIILGQSIGSIALITGFLGRIAAAGNFIIFTGALLVHLPDGWMLNWFGEKKGEGIEYFVLLLALLLLTVIHGSGALSFDYWLWQQYFQR